MRRDDFHVHVGRRLRDPRGSGLLYQGLAGPTDGLCCLCSAWTRHILVSRLLESCISCVFFRTKIYIFNFYFLLVQALRYHNIQSVFI